MRSGTFPLLNMTKNGLFVPHCSEISVRMCIYTGCENDQFGSEFYSGSQERNYTTNCAPIILHHEGYLLFQCLHEWSSEEEKNAHIHKTCLVYVSADVLKERLTHVMKEKKEKTMMAWAASTGMAVLSRVFVHWFAKRQKHTNHRNVQSPDSSTRRNNKFY